jgi:DNA-binding MarR family transcriptional regulator
MLPQRLDILIAFKSISLTPDLSVTDKRVASALIDHFNRQTTQCDPSLDTLAVLLGIDRRTVIRSINRLVRLKYFRRTRHGGNFHRNFYEPLWPRFREVEAEWQSRRRKHSQRFREGKLSLWQGQPVHPAGGKVGTQTSPTNISNEILPAGSVRDDPRGQNASSNPQRLTSKEQCSSIPHPNRAMFHVKETPSRDAANAAAERRWNIALQNRYVSVPKAYGEIIGSIDPAMQAAATEAELKRHGAGLAYILDQLKALQ